MKYAHLYQRVGIIFMQDDELARDWYTAARKRGEPFMFMMENQLRRLLLMPNLREVTIESLENYLLKEWAEHRFSAIKSILRAFPVGEDSKRRCRVRIVGCGCGSILRDREQMGQIAWAWRGLDVEVVDGK